MRLNDMRLTEKVANTRAKPEAVQTLINDGADPNARTKDGDPALSKAVDAEKARVLIEAGANPTAKGPSGYQPVHQAALYGDPDKLRLLLAYGADPNAVSDVGERPMHKAAGSVLHTDTDTDKRLETAEVLLEAGADPNTRDDGGWPPLAQVRGPRMALRLIAAGADPNDVLTSPTPNVLPGLSLPEDATVRDLWAHEGRHDLLQAVDALPAREAARGAASDAQQGPGTDTPSL